jgi:hypothetical protein
MADILLALRVEPSEAEPREPAPPLAADVLAPVFAELEAVLVERLAGVSLDSLCERAIAAGRGPRAPDVDFVI